ncbi:MAG: hypothetical protein KatS3mg057_0082 [Herpetosiphonaceae bacterium]|nr:MAG: hypothetical protein KatS3mg057_0082 [Herpetosiphonaceae bacterium]
MWKRGIPLVLLCLVMAVVVLIVYGSYRWRAATRALLMKMQSSRFQSSIKTYDSRELEGLPAPVQRYFRVVLREGQPLVTAVSVEHTGTFNVSETAEQWKAFTSVQHVVTQHPGFVWDARIHMAPGMSIFVHDAYGAGEGILTASLFGLLTVMEQPSTPQLAQGELMRFFVEGVWYPTALLPSQGVVWEAVDDTQASATFTDGTTAVQMIVQFDEQGLISSVRSSGRYRAVGGMQVATPWQGRVWGYELRDGMLVPLEGEVAWLLAEGPKPYWRGHIQHIEYEYAQ